MALLLRKESVIASKLTALSRVESDDERAVYIDHREKPDYL
jgi:hypothetical protein